MRIQKRNRMSRHLYDIAKLYESDFGKEALSSRSLLETVVRHKSVFFKDNKACYDEATPERLRFVPKDVMLEKFRDDYEDMVKVMFSKEAPTFDEILDILEKIELEIRKL